ncbi:MAG: hypothetical protein AB7O62_14515 [Pirellulales bacterium]
MPLCLLSFCSMRPSRWMAAAILAAGCWLAPPKPAAAGEYEVSNDDEFIKIATPTLEAAIRKKGYVSGVAAGSLLDKKTGFRDIGFGLDIVDWIMEPGSDEAYREELKQTNPEIVYEFNNKYHGKIAKRSIEGPQICTQAKQLDPRVVLGNDFVAVTMDYKYKTAAPGKQVGSCWSQQIVFPQGQRYFVSSDKVESVNSSPAMFQRLDMPGHIKHNKGDTFSEVYLSYHGIVPAEEFFDDFAPDDKFLYRRQEGKIPERFIRGYHLRDPQTGKAGPWLAALVLDPAVVSEAWCHQRGYICMILEYGGRPVKAGESFGAAWIVGYFDSIDEMNQVYDQYRDHTGLKVDTTGWKLTK